MSVIIKNPLTPEQIEKMSTVSEKQIREAQDALFMYLIEEIERLKNSLAGDSGD